MGRRISIQKSRSEENQGTQMPRLLLLKTRERRGEQKELSTGEPDCPLFTFFSRLAQASVQALYKAV